jgi:hypothetical protein
MCNKEYNEYRKEITTFLTNTMKRTLILNDEQAAMLYEVVYNQEPTFDEEKNKVVAELREKLILVNATGSSEK